MSEETSNQNAAESSADEKKGFGAVLKAEREALGISLGDMAARSRLSVAQIIALESENVEELPAPVYVRAFIRDIAGYLNIDSVPLVQDYVSRFGTETNTLGVVPDHDPSNEVVIGRTTGNKKQKYFAVLLIATVIALGCWGVYSELLAPKKEEAVPVLIEKSDLNKAPAVASEAEKKDAVSEVKEEKAEPAVPAAEPAKAEAADAQKAEAKKPGTIRTTLKMSGDCWLQVRTPKGKNLIARDCRAGETFSFDVPPGTIFNLGNADVVTMTVDGKAFDLEKKSNRGIAHFTLK